MPGAIRGRLLRLAARYGLTFFSFGAMQAMQFILPLLALPWLGRVLGPEAFGLLMYMCLIPPLIALVMDWGLGYAGSRQAAWLRGDLSGQSDLLGAALTAKFLLACFCCALGLICWPFLPHAVEHATAYWLAILAGIGRGLSPLWFCQGTGADVPLLAICDTGASLAALLLVFLFIHLPGQWPLYLLFLALCRFCANGGITARLCLKYRPGPNLRAALRLLRSSAACAGSAFAAMFCQNGGQLTLGFFLPAEAMGLIVAVNKMLRSLVAILSPITLTLFPELCILMRKSKADAARMLKCSLLTVLGAALAATALVWLLAPWLIGIALGAKFGAAVPVLRIAILAAPLMALEQALASQALIPCGLEKKMLLVQAFCACASLPLACLLALTAGTDGGASLPVCIELLLLTGMGAIAVKYLPAKFRLTS